MLTAINPQPAINDTGFAELNKAIVQSAIESQNAKKKDLLSKAKTTSSITKKVESVSKVTERQTLVGHLELWRKFHFTLSNLSQLVEDINSNEIFNQYRGTIGVRKLLSVDNPPIQPMIDANIVPRMIEFMQIEHEPQLQLEAAWVLTNVASGTAAQTQLVLDKGAIPWFAKLLRSNNAELKEQCLWALGNIAGDSANKRNLLLKHGVFQPLVKMVDQSDADPRIIKHGTWALSNLCRGRPPPKISFVMAAIPTLFNVIHSQTDVEVLTDAAWALSYLTDHDRTLDLVISCSNAIPSLISYLSHPYLSVLIPCLRSLGNICCGTEVYTDAVLNHPDFLENIYKLLHHTKKTVKRESLWVLSNITAGTPNQIKKVITSFPFIEKFVSMIQNDQEEVKREAIWVLTNAFKNGGPNERVQLCSGAVVNCYIFVLQTTRSTSTLKGIVEGIYWMLKLGQEVAKSLNKEENLVLIELEKAGALDKFDTLQDCEDKVVYENVVKILKEFMPFMEIRPRPESDEDDDEEIDDSDEDN